MISFRPRRVMQGESGEDMTFYENLEKRIQYIDDNLELKSDYSEELEILDGIKSDISVGRYLNNFTPGMAAYLLGRIKEIRDWIIEEQAIG